MAIHIGRRKLMVALGGAAARPIAARAHQAAMPVIGFLDSGFPDTFAHSRMGSVRVQPRLVGATPREVCYDTRRESTT